MDSGLLEKGRSARASTSLLPWAMVGAGGAFILGSLLPPPGPNAAWVRDMLMGVGGSLFLFGPFYFVTRSIDAHLDSLAEESKRDIAAVRREVDQSERRQAEAVSGLRADVDRRLEDVAASVTARLDAESAADREAFASLRTNTPSRETLIDALKRAGELGLIDEASPPRVQVSHVVRQYVAFHYRQEWNDLALRVEDARGCELESIEWNSDDDVTDVLTVVGRYLQRSSSDRFDVAALFTGLADLLEAAQRNPEARPAIQICEPQWLISGGPKPVVTVARGRIYTVELAQLHGSPTISDHVHDKPWVDHDSWDEVQFVGSSEFRWG